MNFYKRFIGDYQRDTGHLSLSEHGAYALMLDAFYATGKPLPIDPKALCRLLRADGAGERASVAAVVRQFWIETPDGLVNERAQIEIEKAGKQAATNQEIAVAREERKRADREARKTERSAHEPSTNRATNDATKSALRARDHSHSQNQITPSVPDGTGAAAPNVRLADLIEEGCDPQAAKDWLAVRAKSRAPLTATAWAGVKREAAKAGMTVPDAVAMAAERSWRGFDAEWVKRGAGSRPGNDRSVAARTMFDVSEREVVDV